MTASATAGLARRWNPLNPLLRALRARLAAWVRRRQGLDTLPVTLERRRLYILPTRGGVAFGALVFVMLLAGLNYSNSLALFLTFLLAAFALVVMQQCHRNLLGVSVVAASAPAVFAARAAAVQVTLADTTAVARFALEAALDAGAPVAGEVPPGARLRLNLPVPPHPRGVVRIERIRISSQHPFGLFRAWTWVHTPIEVLVYPAPVGRRPPPAQPAQRPGRRAHDGSDVDEWRGLRAFRDGDSPRQVDWKAYAREAPLLVKEYQPAGSDLLRFDLAQVPGDTEARLSQLARWIVDAEARGDRYGLDLPQVRLLPEHGPQHRHRCLAALARFGFSDAGAP